MHVYNTSWSHLLQKITKKPSGLSSQWACHELVFCHEMITNPSCIACVVVYNFISTTNSIEKSSKNPWFCGEFSTKYCLPEKQSNTPRSMYQKRIAKKRRRITNWPDTTLFLVSEDRKHDKAYLTRTLYLTRKLAFERVYKKSGFLVLKHSSK